MGIKGNGLARSLFTDADRYQVDFATGDENVDLKLSILATTLMLDYMFFEGETECVCNWCFWPPCKLIFYMISLTCELFGIY